jgi:hypothetical protein
MPSTAVDEALRSVRERRDKIFDRGPDEVERFDAGAGIVSGIVGRMLENDGDRIEKLTEKCDLIEKQVAEFGAGVVNRWGWRHGEGGEPANRFVVAGAERVTHASGG